ncbi:GNAT family acetyltransferase [Achromobacter mucicolens]|uniref:GNAT family acetyltransferase n=1 Tax=Achromobacter mucicolens TaxID=1389922 RepID=UPI003B9CF239
MSQQDLAIRPFQASDETALIALWQACGLTRLGELDGALVATVMGGYDGHRGWINYLAVSPLYRRRHFATALMRAVERKLLEMGCPKINLLIRSENVAVKSFYDSLGFQEDAVISMGKRLIPDL